MVDPTKGKTNLPDAETVAPGRKQQGHDPLETNGGIATGQRDGVGERQGKHESKPHPPVCPAKELTPAELPGESGQEKVCEIVGMNGAEVGVSGGEFQGNISMYKDFTGDDKINMVSQGFCGKVWR